MENTLHTSQQGAGPSEESSKEVGYSEKEMTMIDVFGLLGVLLIVGFLYYKFDKFRKRGYRFED